MSDSVILADKMSEFLYNNRSIVMIDGLKNESLRKQLEDMITSSQLPEKLKTDWLNQLPSAIEQWKAVFKQTYDVS